MWCEKCKEQVYPDGRVHTKEENIEFRKQWDARYEEGQKK
jgi:hypothetical protein